MTGWRAGEPDSWTDVSPTIAPQVYYSFAASPFLSPHVILHSWAGALLSLVKRPIELLAAVIGLWLLVLLRTLEAHAGFP